jgi:pimeloyl-ACP methyl ester carboxylesterase
LSLSFTQEGFLLRIAFRILMILVLAVLASSAFNFVCGQYLRRRYPVPGKIYEVNGAAMHIYCAGTGSPTVVLEAGRGDSWLYWQKVQPELAKTTRVCSYDRAGIGWSDMQLGQRDAVNIAAQLHSLLQKAGETGPLILMGASAGGFYVRKYFSTYPEEIAGMVFADASLPEQIEALSYGKDTEAKRKQRHREAMWQWVEEASGWARLTGNCKGDLEPGLDAYADLARAAACRPSFATSWLGEADEFWHSGAEAAQAHCCGDVPVLIISQDPDRPKDGWSAENIAAQPVWNSLQEGLKKLSPHSRRIIARGSGHHVMTDRPDVLISNTRELVLQIRSKTADPQNGTTIVE